MARQRRTDPKLTAIFNELVGIRNRCVEAAKVLRIILDWAAGECESEVRRLPCAPMLPPPCGRALPAGG
jgi:hypothetical protein